MGGFIDPNCIKVESFQRQTGEVNQFIHNTWLPFSKTILHGSELGQLTIPIRMNTESLHITILIEVRGLTPIIFDGDNGAVILPEGWESTRCVVFVADLSKGVSSATVKESISAYVEV